MIQLTKFYRENIYGVMGTLFFHILVILFFLLSGINIRTLMKEDTVIVDLQSMTEEEAGIQKLEMVAFTKDPSRGNNQGTNEPGRNEPGDNKGNRLTNKGSNFVSAKEDRFFSDDYRKEVSNARNLVSQVNNQLKKEVVKIGDIKMPVENTSGMKRDSIRNVVYSGESNIVYNLTNRYHVSLPIPVYLAQGGGNVLVDIIVDRNGSVVKATSRKNNQIRDPQVFYYAEIAASGTVFNPDQSAPEQQKGTIKYNFIAQ